MDTSPAGQIKRLDASLDRSGQAVTVQRRIGSTKTFGEISVRARFRGYQADDLVNGVKQSDSLFIMSPTPFANLRAWPKNAGGPLFPKIGDFLVVNGVARSIEAIQPTVIGGVTVRYEGRVKG